MTISHVPCHLQHVSSICGTSILPEHPNLSTNHAKICIMKTGQFPLSETKPSRSSKRAPIPMYMMGKPYCVAPVELDKDEEYGLSINVLAEQAGNSGALDRPTPCQHNTSPCRVALSMSRSHTK